MKWAFSDESRRGNQLVMAAAVVETHDVAAIRTEIRRFLRANQRRVHMAKESLARHRQFSSLICGLPIKLRAFTTIVGPRSMPAARELLMAALTTALLRAGVESWTIEAIGEVQEARDRRVTADVVHRSTVTAELVYDHRPPHSEALLWAADALAWLATDPHSPDVKPTQVP